MDMEKLLTDYWSQSVLILGMTFGLIGYFGKRYFDLKAKKKEINHTIFQNMAIEAIKDFFDTYSEVINAWVYVSSDYLLDKDSFDPISLDNIYHKKVTKLSNKSTYAKIFIEHENNRILDKIVSINFQIYRNLAKIIYESQNIDKAFKTPYIESIFTPYLREKRTELDQLIISFKINLEKSMN